MLSNNLIPRLSCFYIPFVPFAVNILHCMLLVHIMMNANMQKENEGTREQGCPKMNIQMRVDTVKCTGFMPQKRSINVMTIRMGAETPNSH